MQCEKRTVMICPRCNQRVLCSPDCDTIEHECNSGNNVLDQEDIPVIGNWTDYTGSGSAKLPNYQGVTNRLQGRNASFEGEDVDEKTVRGNTKETHRQRQHIEFINRK